MSSVQPLFERRTIIRRVTPRMRLRMPFCARSVCRATFEPGEYEDQHVRGFAKVLWCVRGTARVLLDGRGRRFAPDHVAVFLPGTMQKAWAEGEPWEARWFTIDGAQAGDIMRGFGYTRNGMHPAPAAPSELFTALEHALRDVTPWAEARASALAFELLALTVAGPSGSAGHPPPPLARAMSVIDREWGDPALNVESLAEKLGMDRSVLSRTFSGALGIGPSEYLTNTRMRHALSLLTNTDKPVTEIARLAG